MSNDHGPLDLKQADAAQARARKRNRVYAKRVPSALTPDQQRDAVRAVRAGRSIHQVAAEFSVSEIVISELYQRSVEQRGRDFMQQLQAQIQEIDDELHGRKPLAHRAVA